MQQRRARAINWVKRHQVPAVIFFAVSLLSIAAIYGGIPLPDSFPGTADDLSVSEELDSSSKVQRTELFWELWVQDGNEAELKMIPGDPDIRRVEITRADTNPSWHIQLSQMPLAVQANEWYTLRFRARADSLRSMGVTVGQAHDPWENLGPWGNVALMKEWQDYEIEFLMKADDDNARILFSLGGWDVPVEMAAVRLLKLSHGTPRWWLKLRKGSEAGLIVPQEDSGVMQVAITRTARNKSRHIQLIQEHLSLRANERYRAEFRARADAPRQMRVVVSQAEYPWGELGLDQVVSLIPEWQTFEMEFVATGTEENARLHFDLGESAVPVEIAAVTFHGKSAILLEGLE